MSFTDGLIDRAKAALAAPSADRAVFHDGRWYDWGWMRDCGARIGELLDLAGVEDRPVGLVPRNRPTSAAALLSLIATGRSVRMFFAFQSPGALARELVEGGLGAVIASDEDCSRLVTDALTAAGIPVIAIDEETGIGLLGEPLEPLAGDESRGEPFIDVLTSGANAPPKHFTLTHDVIERGLAASGYSYPVSRTDPTMPPLIFFPLGSMSGLYGLLPPALNRNPVILVEKFQIETWLDYVAQYQPPRATLPPSGISALLQRNVPASALAGLGYIGTGAAAIDDETQRLFEERYDVKLLLSYGAPEFGGPVAAMTPELRQKWGNAKPGSVGPAWGGAEIRTVDIASGAPTAVGTQGRLEVRSPIIGGDWIRTDDLGLIDEDGFLFLLGRADGAISRGGFSIQPELIERAIRSYPGVEAAAVVGLAHRRLGEVPAAAVQLADPEATFDIADLERHVGEHVYASHVPVHFRVVRALPLTPAMTIDRGKVRALFERDTQNYKARGA